MKKKQEIKKIVIIGYAKEGQWAFLFLKKKFPQAEFTIVAKDKILNAPPRVEVCVGKKYLKNICNFDLIVKSTGVSPFLPEIVRAKNLKIEITSVTKLFFENCRGRVIGVTGTKGKSTTSTLICKILKQAKKKVFLVGNIGNNPLQHLGQDEGRDKIFVYELSSHQLADLEKSPEIAVFLNIFPDHLIYHKTYTNYKKAKKNIALYQGDNDYFVYNKNYSFINNLSIKSHAKSVDYLGKCKLDEGNIYFEKEQVCPVSKIKLLGKHNLDNIFASICVAKILKVSTEDIVKTITGFKGLEHRLEFVGRHKEIDFYDDAISTTPESTIEAIKIFQTRLGSIILGGQNRGYKFVQLAKHLHATSVDAVVLFPDSGAQIWAEIKTFYKTKKTQLPRQLKTSDMAEAVKFCYANTAQNKVCLLSTASPSYSIFKNFEEKGKKFKDEVKKQSA